MDDGISGIACYLNVPLDTITMLQSRLTELNSYTGTGGNMGHL